MRIAAHQFTIAVCALLLLALLVPSAVAVSPQEPDAASSQQQGNSFPASQPQAQQPETSGKTPNAASPQSSVPDSPGAMQAQSADQNRLSDAQQSPPQPAQQNPTRVPVGTAAAGPVITTGVAASKPAGAAIAPAKQRRVRTILIKVGAVVGAGVAIGTVAALATASPSKPPGAR